ncbi:helix-turn-helix domain-containing protein [Sphaerospermopsis aphanizomenoides]|uniref:helix-turn-helix domain-containing protein n=1 Tax=Sphaerospermopsis aphanizomenoides TaxID=459663 RepID=UPI002AD2ABA6|nr:helix-turn-helix transcriptional regulator [Sphaerospermopsis aphanizomenoides]
MLRTLREKSGLSQEQLAVALGVGSSTLRRWENGGAEPSMTKKQWDILCNQLGKKFDELPDELAVQIEVHA